MMTSNHQYHGVPADAELQQALDAALQLDREAGMAAKRGLLSQYDSLHAAARDQWQAYRARLAALQQKKSETHLTRYSSF